MRRMAGLVMVAVLGLAVAPGRAAAGETAFVNIATATTGGTFYPAGIAMAQLYNEKLGGKGIKASAQTSAGSVENIDLLRKKETELAIIQNNVALWAYEGNHQFAGKAYKDLRLLFPLFPSHYHLMVREGAGIGRIADLKGKRFVVGRPGSGTENAAKLVLEVFGVTYKDFTAEFLGQAEAIDALKNRRVDGAMILGGIPIGAVGEAMAVPRSVARILSLSREEIDRLNKAHPWMVPVTIPRGTYSNQPADMQTVAHVVFLMGRSDLPGERVHDLVKVTYDNLETLRKAHGTFRNMSLEGGKPFLKGFVPLHPGAEKYFKEIGAL